MAARAVAGGSLIGRREEDRRLAAEVDVRRRDVLQGFMQPAVVVVLDEAPDRAFEFPGTV